ncbi:MAG: hypothetical protein AAB378_02140 [Patescibacteria group bacterium]
MHLTDKIEQLQNKSEAERKKIMIISLIIGMTLITGIWIATIKNRLQTSTREDTAQKPWSLLWNDASDAFSTVKTGIITTWSSLKTGKTNDNAAPQESDLIYNKNQ